MEAMGSQHDPLSAAAGPPPEPLWCPWAGAWLLGCAGPAGRRCYATTRQHQELPAPPVQLEFERGRKQ